MKNYILEVCVDSVESALAAKSGGATRLELCANLIIGGTTPGYALFEQIRKTIEKLKKLKIILTNRKVFSIMTHASLIDASFEYR